MSKPKLKHCVKLALESMHYILDVPLRISHYPLSAHTFRCLIITYESAVVYAGLTGIISRILETRRSRDDSIFE